MTNQRQPDFATLHRLPIAGKLFEYSRRQFSAFQQRKRGIFCKVRIGRRSLQFQRPSGTLLHHF